MSQNNGQDATLKTVGTVALAVVVFALLYNILLGGGRTGLGLNLSYGWGFNLNSFLVSVLILAVKLLWLVLVISLVLGFIAVIKKYLFDDKNLNLCCVTKTGSTCPNCGTKVDNEFKFCPGCGTEKQ